MEILLDNWSGYGTSIPLVTTDAGGRPYLAWSIGEKASANFRLPESYVVGTDLTLVIKESTPGQSKKHKWSIDVSRELDTAETVTEEFTSSATASELTEREITLTSDGELNGVALAVGDEISVVLSRIAASGTEDSNDIRTYTASIWVDSVDYGQSGCLGRVGTIIDDVRADFNDTMMERISNTEIIQWLNRAKNTLARKSIFRKESALDVTAGVGQIVIADQITDYVKGYNLRWWEDTDFMAVCPSWERFQILNLGEALENSNPEVWIILSDVLHFWPVPDASVSSGLYLYHSYVPADLNCSSNYDPDFPVPFDETLEEYALWKAFSKFHRDPGCSIQADKHEMKWLEALNDLEVQESTPLQGVYPYR